MVKAATAERIKDTPIDVQAADVGRRIRQARLERGLSLAKLGGDDLSRSFLSLVELGRSRISLRALGIVAERMELPISYFLTDDPGTGETVAELTLDQAEGAIGRRKPSDALRTLDEVEIPDKLRARALYLRGWALIDQGSAREAIPVLHEAVPLADAGDDDRLMVEAHYKLAMALYLVGSYDESLSHLRRALDRAQQDPEDITLVGKITVALGHVMYMQGNAEKAVEHYQRAREIFGRLNDLETLASIYSGLSLAYKRKDDLANALRYSKLSLGAYEAKQNSRAAAHELNNMAVRYQEMGNLTQAQQCAQESIERAQSVNAPEVEALARSTLASVYLAMGQLDRAKAEAEIANRMASDDKDLARIYSWLVLAKIADGVGDYARSDDLYRRALDVLKETQRHAIYADAALAYSLALRTRGEVEGALDLALQAAQAKSARPA
jgi:tetratricopeptide (TPR) repeat protein